MSLLITFFSHRLTLLIQMSMTFIHLMDFEDAVKQACEMKLKDAKSTYKCVDEGNLSYLWMELVH